MARLGHAGPEGGRLRQAVALDQDHLAEVGGERSGGQQAGQARPDHDRPLSAPETRHPLRPRSTVLQALQQGEVREGGGAAPVQEHGRGPRPGLEDVDPATDALGVGDREGPGPRGRRSEPAAVDGPGRVRVRRRRHGRRGGRVDHRAAARHRAHPLGAAAYAPRAPRGSLAGELPPPPRRWEHVGMSRVPAGPAGPTEAAVPGPEPPSAAPEARGAPRPPDARRRRAW